MCPSKGINVFLTAVSVPLEALRVVRWGAAAWGGIVNLAFSIKYVFERGGVLLVCKCVQSMFCFMIQGFEHTYWVNQWRFSCSHPDCNFVDAKWNDVKEVISLRTDSM
jgi:hypothetical protein